MATSFGIGDTVILARSGNKYRVLSIYGNKAFVVRVSGGEAISMPLDSFKLAPDFFEVGKTYQYRTDRSLKFDCHYIGKVGASGDNKRYAAGQRMFMGSICPTTATDFDSWEEL